MVAAENGHLKVVTHLLSRYDNYALLTDVCKQKRNVFHYVADKGHVDVARVLLEKADTACLLPDILNQLDIHNLGQLCSLVDGKFKERAAYHYVYLRRKCLNLFQKCVKEGLVNATHFGTIVLSAWDSEPEPEARAKALEQYQYRESTRAGQKDLSPTLLAIANNHEEVAKLFIEAGGDGTVRDCFGETGMHLAAMRGNSCLAELLKDHGVALDTKDKDGDTPRDIARINDQDEQAFTFNRKEHPQKDQVWCYWRVIMKIMYWLALDAVSYDETATDVSVKCTTARKLLNSRQPTHLAMKSNWIKSKNTKKTAKMQFISGSDDHQV